MKKVILMLSAAAVFASCSNQTASETTEQAVVSTDSTGVNYLVDTLASVMNWEATKIVGGHNGTIRIADGSFNVKEGNIVSGGFTINMNTIVNSDITDAKMNSDLVNHLKSPDFFNVAGFPVAKFEVTGSEVLSNDPAGNTHTISGNLTVKDSVKNISFPIKVSSNGDDFTAEGTAVINRLQWGIVYNSVSVSPAALLKKIGDNAIKDEVSIKFSIKAKKG